MIPSLTKTQQPIGNSAGDDQRQQLAEILDEYLRGLEQGEPIEPAELIERHPEVADRLRGYLSGLALFHHAAAIPPPPPPEISSGPAPGSLLGDFRLLREIGRGGMGVVYEAVQLSLGRRVAVKLLPFSGPVHEKQIARFKHEAQAAAQIDHPHIVPVFAIGQENGTHYFAMQLIGGKSLADFITERREAATPAAEPLDHVMSVARLGLQAAEALNAAHEIGVVHRDVKPSNLLLDEKGKLWVTDFGVARCKSNECLTETGYVVGSMPYMSPEQALGQAALVDHRTDVYSLGITLYELATLRHPCEGTAHAETAIEYTRSHWRRPRCWNSSIPVDFENIVLKAMAESRDERYGTARELADDLRRFLEGQPIIARPPSLAARVEKWARRHRGSVAAAAAALALGVIGLIVSLALIAAERSEKDTAWRAARENHLRAERNYQRAEAKFRQAREVLDRFGSRVNEMLASDLPGSEGVRRKLLAEMLPYYREFAREAASDPTLQADLALTYSKIGYLSDQLGAQADSERAHRDAKATLAALTRAHPSRQDQRRLFALCCNNLGQTLQKRGAIAAAKSELEQALAIQQRLRREPEPLAGVAAELATTHGNLGLLFAQTGDKQQAAEQFQAALEIQESLHKLQPHDETCLYQLAASYNNLSSISLPGDPATARQWIERALALQLDLVRAQPARRDYQSDLALSYNNLGAIHSRLGDSKNAQLCYRDAITIQQRLASAAPMVTTYRRDLAASYNNLGLAQAKAAAAAEAESSFRAALKWQQELVEEQPRSAVQLSSLGSIYNNLGLLQQRQSQLQAACDSFAQAVAAQQQAFTAAPDVPRYRDALSKHYFNQAAALRELDRPEEAAAAIAARRDLWLHDKQRLLRIAEELAALCNEIAAADVRELYLHEVALTRAAAAKVSPKQSAPRASQLDVIFREAAAPDLRDME